MAKKPELHFDYDEIKFEAHQRAFTVAKVTQIDLLAEIQASLENAFVEGQSFETWRKNLKPTLQKHGWLGQTSVINPKTGEEKEIFVGAKRLKTIFYTNARTAYAQAEARAGYELKLSEYIRYVAILDNRVRPEHAALHGKIAHRNDDFWKTNYPPNGWNCRCSVEFISKDEMDELGWTEMSDIEKTLNYAEKGWDKDGRNLNKDNSHLQDIIKDKLKSHAANKTAKEALNALKLEINTQKQRFDYMRQLWNATNGQEKRSFGKVNDFLGENVPNLKEKEISINAKTMKRHKKKHPEIGAFEYSIIPYILDKDAILGVFKDFSGKGDEIFVVSSKMGVQYRLTLFNAEKGVYVRSLASNEKDKRDIYSKLKRNKDKVWLKEDAR